MHIHQVTSKKVWFHLDRVFYMSSLRSFDFYRFQREIMRDLNVTLLDLYPATFLSSHELRKADGRHCSHEFNQKMLSWFYKDKSDTRQWLHVATLSCGWSAMAFDTCYWNSWQGRVARIATFPNSPSYPHVPLKRPGEEHAKVATAVAISKTLFAPRSVWVVEHFRYSWWIQPRKVSMVRPWFLWFTTATFPVSPLIPLAQRLAIHCGSRQFTQEISWGNHSS